MPFRNRHILVVIFSPKSSTLATLDGHWQLSFQNTFTWHVHCKSTAHKNTCRFGIGINSQHFVVLGGAFTNSPYARLPRVSSQSICKLQATSEQIHRCPQCRSPPAARRTPSSKRPWSTFVAVSITSKKPPALFTQCLWRNRPKNKPNFLQNAITRTRCVRATRSDAVNADTASCTRSAPSDVSRLNLIVLGLVLKIGFFVLQWSCSMHDKLGEHRLIQHNVNIFTFK